jgi:DivIVA domain-containing protein
VVLLLAGAAVMRLIRIWWADRHLIGAERGLPVALRRWDDSHAMAYGLDGFGVPIAKLRTRPQLVEDVDGDVGEERGTPLAGQRNFWASLDSDPPRSVHLVGQLWYRGIAHVVTDGREGDASALMGLPLIGRFVGQLAPFLFDVGDVEAVAFNTPPWGKRGSARQDVDAFMDRLIAAFRGTGPPVTSDDVNAAVFATGGRGRDRGYDRHEVDGFLDRVATECE